MCAGAPSRRKHHCIIPCSESQCSTVPESRRICRYSADPTPAEHLIRGDLYPGPIAAHPSRQLGISTPGKHSLATHAPSMPHPFRIVVETKPDLPAEYR